MEATEGQALASMEDISHEHVEVPKHFICPISQDLMIDPVVAADGFTYENRQITQWL